MTTSFKVPITVEHIRCAARLTPVQLFHIERKICARSEWSRRDLYVAIVQWLADHSITKPSGVPDKSGVGSRDKVDYR